MSFRILLSIALALNTVSSAHAQVFESTDANEIPDSLMLGMGYESTTVQLPNGAKMIVPRINLDVLNVSKNSENGGINITSAEASYSNNPSAGFNFALDVARLSADELKGVGFGVDVNSYEQSRDAFLRAGLRPGGVVTSNGHDYIVFYALVGASLGMVEHDASVSLSGQNESASGFNFSYGMSLIAKYAAFTLRTSTTADLGTANRVNMSARVDYAANESLNLYGKVNYNHYGINSSSIFPSDIVQTRVGIEIVFRK